MQTSEKRIDVTQTWQFRVDETGKRQIYIGSVQYRSLPYEQRMQVLADKAQAFRIRFGINTPSPREDYWRARANG